MIFNIDTKNLLLPERSIFQVVSGKVCLQIIKGIFDIFRQMVQEKQIKKKSYRHKYLNDIR